LEPNTKNLEIFVIKKNWQLKTPKIVSFSHKCFCSLQKFCQGKKRPGRGKGRNVLASAVSHLFSIIPEITMQKNQQKTQ